MADIKEWSGFKVPARVSLDKSQFKDLQFAVTNIIEGISKGNKELKFMFQNIDSTNVTRLNTNITSITSEDGETIIDGPLLKMYDATPTLRLEMGYDGTDFTFEMYDESSNKTIDIESDGTAVLRGKVDIGDSSGGHVVISKDATYGAVVDIYDDTDVVIGMFGTSTLASLQSSADTFGIVGTGTLTFGATLGTLSPKSVIGFSYDNTNGVTFDWVDNSGASPYTVGGFIGKSTATSFSLNGTTSNSIAVVKDLTIFTNDGYIAVVANDALYLSGTTLYISDDGTNFSTGQTGNWTVDGTTFTFVNGILTGVA